MANKLISVFNSYLGMMVHYSSYKLRKKLARLICHIYRGVLLENKEATKIIIWAGARKLDNIVYNNL